VNLKEIVWKDVVVSHSSIPQAGGPPLIGCLRLFIQYIRSNPPLSEGRLLHPQPEGVPCRGNKGTT